MRVAQLKVRRKKNVKKGIQFCLMVCGASGTGMCSSSLSSEPVLTVQQGRTTFVNTLCGKRVLQPKDADDAANAHLEEGVRIKPVTVGTCKEELHTCRHL
jgi:cell division control protein 11